MLILKFLFKFEKIIIFVFFNSFLKIFFKKYMDLILMFLKIVVDVFISCVYLLGYDLSLDLSFYSNIFLM